MVLREREELQLLGFATSRTDGLQLGFAWKAVFCFLVISVRMPSPGVLLQASIGHTPVSPIESEASPGLLEQPF